ncbi:uncharacterized protein LOC110237362 [Exaiptasia diaphana]|uniref:THAP-type domain-containing protein n=1 Tax=Exaiptasia diaphana TaxID=2652724 RepID=A0A913X3Y9_EXADI|nr:uncharacterized protein LOC110237362 [Exaiptasia diaphana]
MAEANVQRKIVGGFSCCVPGCFNNSKKDKGRLSFYVIPKDNELRKLWFHKISRQGFKPKKEQISGFRVCSEHFEGGAKTYSVNVPTIFPLSKSHVTAQKEPRRKLNRHTIDSSSVEENARESSCSIKLTTNKMDDSNCEVSEQEKIAMLEEKLMSLDLERKQLLARIDIERFGVERFRMSDSDMLYYTGLENYEFFKALYEFLDSDCGAISRLNFWGSNNSSLQFQDTDKCGKKRSLIPADELFLTLSRLRVNMAEKVLADQFRISVSEVSRIFATYLDFMYTRFIQLDIWASRETIDKTMPESFRVEYPFTRIILDCTELFIQKPSCFRAQSETYSTYKSHNTAKGLIGIAPYGAVTFVSDLFGGHASDKEIVEATGILDKFEEGDSVMADRGFEIRDLLMARGCSLNIPPFMRCKDRLDPEEETETREIAAVRIHVERAIERIKNYNILSQIIPNSMAEDLNKIWKVCSYLTNFKGNLVT